MRAFGFCLMMLTAMLCVVSCRHEKKKADAQLNDEAAKSRAREIADSIGTHTPSPLQAFMERQISTANIQFDHSWKKHLDDTDSWIVFDSYNDPPDSCYEFPFQDIKMTLWFVDMGAQHYHDSGFQEASQFTINGYKMSIDDDAGRTDPKITPADIRRFHYRNRDFIVFWGHLRHYNGYGDRVQFNYFFDITACPPVQDIYTNFNLYVYYPFLYGDLNNDTLLDRLVYDGVDYPFCEDTCSVTISAQTYKGRRWQALRDPRGNPYYIRLRTDGGMDGFKVLSSNWMNPIAQ